MNYYVIGIGGTGAKCIEAFTHLCAAGMMPEGNIDVAFVDADTANGNLAKAKVTLDGYIDCRELQIGQVDLFKNLITIREPIWSPVTKGGLEKADRSFAEVFEYPVLKAVEPQLADLFDVLYTKKEQNTDLDMGFRGHPSIGAAVMADAMDLENTQPWDTIFKNIRNERATGIKIFIFGSIFGGTGAAGFPTIGRLIRNALPSPSLQLGGALLLPYFCFTSDNHSDDDLFARSENFLLNNQAALKYYHDHYDKIYNDIYLLGNSTLKKMERFEIGAATQQNEPHFVEIYAALAAIDFFTEKNASPPTSYRMVARSKANEIDWQDLPDRNNGNKLQKKIRQLTRFAVSFLHVYYPYLMDILDHKKEGYQAPWYIDFFERQRLQVTKDDISLSMIKNYCERYLDWLQMVHCYGSNFRINLVNHQILKDPERAIRYFGNLVHPITKQTESKDLDRVWENMCSTKISDQDASPFGKFIQALYSACV